MVKIKTIAGAAGALVAGTVAAQAGGLDRSGQGIGALFEKGNYAELSFGSVTPDVSGRDTFGNATGDVAVDYLQMGFAYRRDINQSLSYAIIVDQPFGAEVLYSGDPARTLLGGTRAVVDSVATTVILRYKFDDNISVHGGLRANYASAAIDLRGLGFAGLNGYSATFADDVAVGYLLGASYEIPEIALRVAVTYNSEMKHEFETQENFLPGVTTITPVETPKSVNVDLQTGIAKDTLVFGQIRWVDWSSFKVSPRFFSATPAGPSLVNLEDSTTYTLGVGRRFSDTWSGAFSMTYEEKGDPLVSPLAPTNGRIGATLAAIYTMDDVKVTAGISYSKLGDANPQTAGTPRGSMTGSSVLGFGIKVGYSF